MPYLLAFAAGAMLYVVVEELIPEASQGEHSNLGTIGFAAGFVLMMILDVALGKAGCDTRPYCSKDSTFTFRTLANTFSS